MRRQRQHERDVRKADRAVRAIIASVVVGVIALALALLVSPSTVLVVDRRGHRDRDPVEAAGIAMSGRTSAPRHKRSSGGIAAGWTKDRGAVAVCVDDRRSGLRWDYMFLLLTGASGSGKSTRGWPVANELATEVECVELGHVARVLPVTTIAWAAAGHRGCRAPGAGPSSCRSAPPARRRSGRCRRGDRRTLRREAPRDRRLSSRRQRRSASPRLAQRGDDPRLLADHQAFAGGCAPTHRIQTTCPTS